MAPFIASSLFSSLLLVTPSLSRSVLFLATPFLVLTLVHLGAVTSALLGALFLVTSPVFGVSFLVSTAVNISATFLVIMTGTPVAALVIIASSLLLSAFLVTAVINAASCSTHALTKFGPINAPHRT